MRAAIQLVCCAIAGVAVMASAGAASAQAQQENGRSTASGVYTAEQAAQGENVFQNVCVNCHTTSQFTGAAFQKTWGGRPVFGLFDLIRTAMPMDNPGGLSRSEYLTVITYILKLNGMPAGKTELPDDDDALKQILFEPPPSSKN